MTDSQDNDFIKAVTGLEGGCVACGSTCGVVSCGSLGIALNHESEIAANGLSVRDMSYWKIINGFSVGHVNLLVDRPFGTREPFNAEKQVVKKFEKIAGSFECQAITEKKFSGWDDFQAFIKGASQCRKLMDFAVEEASRIIR